VTPARARRRRVALIATSLLLGAGIIAGAVFISLNPPVRPVDPASPHVAGKPAATPTPAPTTSTPTTAPPTTKDAAEKDAAEKAATSAAENVIKVTNATLRNPTTVPQDLGTYTSGFVEGEIRALAAERASLGYTQVGSARITSITVRKADLKGSPPTILLDVCIDSSGIDVRDASGTSLKELLYNPGHPVLNVYGAQYLAGTWRITTHDLPEKDTCS